MTAHDSLARPRAARLTVDDFVLLDRAGAFADYARSELIDGTIIVVNAEYSAHFKLKNRLYRRIADACDRLGGGLQAWSDGSVAIAPHSVPEPDVFVTSVEPEEPLVDVATVLLAVEVAASSLDQDLGKKLQLYAAARVPEILGGRCGRARRPPDVGVGGRGIWRTSDGGVRSGCGVGDDRRSPREHERPVGDRTARALPQPTSQALARHRHRPRHRNE